MTQVSLKTLARDCRLTVVYGARLDWDKQDDWQRSANGYHCTLVYMRTKRRYSFDFWQGVGIEREPDVEGCLECLLSDAESGELGFNEFCDEFGYDSDSIKARDTWKACQKTAKNLRRVLGADFETFLYSDRN